MRYGLLIFSLYSLSALSAMSEWVNQQGCYVGKLRAPVAFVSKGNGSTAEKQASSDQLNYWNQYAKIFDPITMDSGLSRPSNGLNEINTFMSIQDTLDRYNMAIDEGTYGVALIQPEANFGDFNECKDFNAAGGSDQGGYFDEVDVVINADFYSGWTTDTNDYSGPAWIQTTALHELGHAWGAHHVFSLPAFGDSFSVMNYVKDDVGMFVTRMDANTIRAAYPNQANNHLVDVAIFPFTYGNDTYEATYASVSPTEVKPGESITISNLLIQNLSPSAINDPVKIHFYLSTDQQISTSDYLIATAQFDSLPQNADQDLTLNMNIPNNMPAGDYYIGAIVVVNDQSDDVSINNTLIIGSPKRTVLTVSKGQEPPSGSNLVQDPGFENGANNSGWQSDSTNFGTVICSIEFCGDGGIGPYEGDWWAWFGGIALADEYGSVAQQVNIPQADSAKLSFYFAIPVSEAPGYFRAFIDETELFNVDQNANYPSYQKIEIDISRFADGQNHTLYFESYTSSASGVTNFMLDNVSIIVSNSGNNQCSGSSATLSGDLSGDYYCQVSDLITTEGRTTVKNGAKVELSAPKIRLNPLFKVEKGGQLKLK